MKEKKLLAASLVASALLMSSAVSHANETTVDENSKSEPLKINREASKMPVTVPDLTARKTDNLKEISPVEEEVFEELSTALPVWDENTGEIKYYTNLTSEQPQKATKSRKGVMTGAAARSGGEIGVDVASPINNQTFSNGDYTSGEGGALYNETVDAAINNTVFNTNAANQGGAIFNYSDDVTTGNIDITNGTFSGNTSVNQGGAIFNYGTMTVDGATFTGNKSTGETWLSQGGAVFNSGDDDYWDVPSITMEISNATFGDKNDATKGNQAMYGGAIANESSLIDGEITLNNVNFYYNKAHADTDSSDGYTSSLGGAIYNGGIIGVNGATEFVGNKAEGYAVEGGAISNLDTGTITFNDEATFNSNIANRTINGNGAIGGALYNEGVVIFKEGATFDGNKAMNTGGTTSGLTYLSKGGAIFNESYGSPAAIDFQNGAVFTENQADLGGAIFNEEGTITLKNAAFTKNSAGEAGGAIFNFDAMTFNGDTKFTENTSGWDGGAIYNVGTAIINGDTTFADNKAGGYGGAIYNEGTLTINGAATFTGNKMAYVDAETNAGNDIYNEGTLNLNAAADKTISISDGIWGTDGTLNINANSTDTGLVSIDGGIINQSTATVSYGELQIMNGQDDGANLSGTNLTVGANAVVNTIDNVINDYTSSITLADGAGVKLDANMSTQTVDTFTVADGSSITVDELNILADGASGTINIADYGNVIADGVKAYTSSNTYTVAGNNVNDGTITITCAAGGGLNAAVDDTNPVVAEKVTYNMTGNETFEVAADTTIQRANFTINGNDKTVTAADDATGIKVDANSVVTVQNATFKEFDNDAQGAIKNQGTLTLEGVSIDNTNTVGVVNTGTTNVIGSAIASIDNTGTANVIDSAITSINNAGTLNMDLSSNLSTAIQNAAGTTNVNIAEGNNVEWVTPGITQTAMTFTGAGHIELSGGPVVADITNNTTGDTLVIDDIVVTGDVINNPGAHMVLTNDSYVDGTITNDGIFDILNGTFNLPTGIAQTGTTSVLNIGDDTNSSVVTLTAGQAINQQNLNILSKGSLTADLGDLHVGSNTIANAGNLILNLDNTGADTPLGYTITGDGITTIDADGHTITLDTDAHPISNAINLTAGTFKATSATGAQNFTGIIANGGILDVADNHTGAVALGALDLANSDLNVKMDASIAAGTADVLSATSVTGSNKINVANLNLLTTSPAAFDINVADNSVKAYVDMSNTTISGAATALMYTYSTATGNITGVGSINSVADAVTSTAVDPKMYAMAGNDDSLSGSILAGTALSITGNGHEINAANAGDDGIVIANADQTLSITGADLGATKAFGTAIDNTAGGTVNLTNVTITSTTMDVVNEGTLNLAGAVTLSNVDGDGTTNITGAATVNTAIAQAIVNVADGATLTNAGDLTAQLNNEGTINGAGNLILSGASTNSGSITQTAITNNGMLTVSGESTPGAGDAGSIAAAITNNADDAAIINGGTITGNVTNAAGMDGILIVNGGTITGNVDNGNGAGNVLTNVGTIGGNVINTDGIVATTANGVAGTVTNDGTLYIDGGDGTNLTFNTTNSAGDTSVGETFILGVVNTAAGKAILQATVNIGDDTDPGNMHAGTLNATIANAVTADAINVAANSTLAIADGASVSAAADGITLNAATSTLSITDNGSVTGDIKTDNGGNIELIADAADVSMAATLPNNITDTTGANDGVYTITATTKDATVNDVAVTIDRDIAGATAVNVSDATKATITDTAINSLDANSGINVGNGSALTLNNTGATGDMTVANTISATTAGDSYNVNIENAGGDATILDNTITGAENVNLVSGELQIGTNADNKTSTSDTLGGATLNIADNTAATIATSADNYTIDNNISTETPVVVNQGELELTGAADTEFSLANGVTIADTAVNLTSGQLDIGNASAFTGTSTIAAAAGTTISAMDGQATNFGNNITLADGSQIKADVNVATGASDNFAGTNQLGQVILADVNPAGIEKIVRNNTNINLTENLGINDLVIANELQGKSFKAMTPIRRMEATVDNNGIMNIHPSSGRNNWIDFQPSILAGSVAAQMGGYLTQLNSYDEAFRNMDMHMLMTREQRQAMKFRNKYALSNGLFQFDPNYNHMEQAGAWFRPYANFEKVDLKHGPNVESQAYGSYFGGDSGLHELGHGWDGMFSVYAGYNGSHQHYLGQSIFQNGGTLGVAGMAYKGNFFVGGTVNAGASAGEASTTFGHDDFMMMMAGVAAKAGYNWELAKGKFIIQPSYQMSYSFVNTFDYTSSNGAKIHTNPLNAIQIEPGIKFIGNLKNGWQPYAGISMVWTIMDGADFKANDIALPEMSVKPYVKYGIGVRKAWGERLTGFGQTYITNGGRNGIGIQFGFRWAIGKDPLGNLKKSSVPKMEPAKISLQCMKK